MSNLDNLDKRKKEIINFLSELIKFKTTSDNQEELEKCAKFIVKYAENLGLEAEIVYGEVPNVIIKRSGKGKKVAFVSHFDVVPPGENWSYDPFKPTIVNDKIYGRGACDDKGHLVSTFFALLDAEELNIDPIMAIAGGEETQRSTEFYKEIAKKVEIAIVTDTGPLNEIHIGSSGFLGYYLKIKGKQGHSAYDYAFDDPILKLDKVIKKLNEIKEYAKNNFLSNYPGRKYKRVPVRIYPTVIESKPKVINIVPSEVEILVNIRTVPEYNNEFIEKFFIESFKEFDFLEIEKHPIELKPWLSKFEETENFKKIVEKVIGKEVKLGIMPGGSDGVHFFEQGCKVIEYGFSDNYYNIHGPNEFIETKALLTLYKILKKVIEKGV